MLVTATAYIVINLLVDLLYSLIDPRIRVAGEACMSVVTALTPAAPPAPPAGVGTRGVAGLRVLRRLRRNPLGDHRLRRARRRRPRRGARARGSRRTPPTQTDFANAVRAARHRRVTCSAPTTSAATSSPGSCSGAGPRCRSAAARRRHRARRRRAARPRRRLLPGGSTRVISRFTDLLLAFPFLILAVGLAAIRGRQPRQRRAWPSASPRSPGVIRVVRSETLRLKSLDFVAAAVVDGRQRPVGARPAHPARTPPR